MIFCSKSQLQPQQSVPYKGVERSANSDEASERVRETPKPKLKQLHWDKDVHSRSTETSLIHRLNEEMMESLLIVKPPTGSPAEINRRQILPLPSQEDRVLDPKKSQNIAILLKALHVIVDKSLLKMAPTKEEVHNLRYHKDDSPVKLGTAERFLKEVLDIPFAFKRVEAMLYISNFDSEVEYLKRSFETLETASEELRNNRMFMMLLEAVLKTGGTNRGDAHAFKLDSLLKLVDIKGADGKTTLVHFVVQEINRSEGARISPSNPNQSFTTKLNQIDCYN